VNAPQEVCVPRVRAESFVTRIELEPRQPFISLLISFFEPLECLVIVAKSRRSPGNAGSWNVLCFLLYFFLRLLETLAPVALRPRLPQSLF
jgi:hypothetical protein